MMLLLLTIALVCPLQIYNNSAYKLFLFERGYYHNLTFNASNLTCGYLGRLLSVELNHLRGLHMIHIAYIKSVKWPGKAAAMRRLLNYDEEYLIDVEEKFNSTCSGECTSKYFVLYNMLVGFYSWNLEASNLLNSSVALNITEWSHDFINDLAIYNPIAPLPMPAQVEENINNMIRYIESQLDSITSAANQG